MNQHTKNQLTNQPIGPTVWPLPHINTKNDPHHLQQSPYLLCFWWWRNRACVTSATAMIAPWRSNKSTPDVTDSIAGRAEHKISQTLQLFWPAPTNHMKSVNTEVAWGRWEKERSRWWVQKKITWTVVMMQTIGLRRVFNPLSLAPSPPPFFFFFLRGEN